MGEVDRSPATPAVTSFDHYDFSRAKIRGSLTWLVAKAYGTDSVPTDLRELFYTDQYEQEHLKPSMTSLLLSADLYCRAGSRILKKERASWSLLDHQALIQALAQRGLYVTDQERLVTESDLRRRPLQMSAHLAMIDALMMAHTLETVSPEKVTACVRQYSSSRQPEVEKMPYDTEDALVTWINKVNEYQKERMVQEQQRKKETQRTETEESPRSPTKWYMKLVPVRYRKETELWAKSTPWIPRMVNLLEDGTDGSALAALLHFFCPQLLPLEDVCLKKDMTLSERVSNLQLIQDFCQDNLNSCCHLRLEDLLYASSTIKNNYLVFLAELFWWFEEAKPSFVKPVLTHKHGTESSALFQSILAERTSSPEGLSLPFKPQSKSSGEMKRSTSMSFVDGNLGTWPKEKRSGPYGVSFDIPFDKDDSAPAPLSSAHGMVRSVSTDDGSGFKVNHLPRGIRRNLSFQPVNGQNVGIGEEEGGGGGYPCGAGGAEPVARAPSMEALHIIQFRPPVEGINYGFFLHTPGHWAAGSDLVSELDSKGRLSSADTTEVDTGVHLRTEDILDEEDSSLKDCSIHMELELDTPSPCPSSKSPSGSKLTCFAEQKLRKLNPSAPDSGRGSCSSLKTTPEGSELGLQLSVSWAPTPEHSPVRHRATPPAPSPPVQLPPDDPARVMATEMVQLRMRLEEKRKAIEAQKRKVEVAFARHRQKTGHSAFLGVVKRKGDGAASEGRGKANAPDGAEQSDVAPHCASPREDAGGQSHVQRTEEDLTEYTRSIEKLNHSLVFLQGEMHRLARQQEVIMAMREQQHQQAWVSAPRYADPSPQKHQAAAAARSSGPSSPTDSPQSARRSPATIKRKSASFHSRGPRAAATTVIRPSELKLAPYNRVLSAPRSVDSIPRLRRFSPCQPLASSFVYMGEKPSQGTAPPGGEKNQDAVREIVGVCVVHSPPGSPSKQIHLDQSQDCEMFVEADRQEAAKNVPTTEAPPPPDKAKNNLIEVPLSVVKPTGPGEPAPDNGLEMLQGSEDGPEEAQRMCRGFFFKDDEKAEENMAQKRAALLEKRMRRERESQQRKMQLEAELEQKKEDARMKTEEERLRKEEDKARKEFIKQEYLRRKQLKLMEDMDTVIKPRLAACGAKQRRGRPKLGRGDSIDSPRTPVRVATVSSILLASLNLGDSDSAHSEKRTPRSSSLASGSLFYFLSSSKLTRRRPESVDGSPSRSSSRNREKDWENGSTTSSVTSNTEYTGPKLYKEPSAKSNKHIIQNALSHCCLAGKVNEGQKNKILEEMEKSEANNFLVLFRDAGCQFRSLYTYCPETEEINKLTGIGPKSVAYKMIDGLYKYNSDRKQFSQIPAKTLSASVDAITIHSHLWQTKKPATPKKVVSAPSL